MNIPEAVERTHQMSTSSHDATNNADGKSRHISRGEFRRNYKHKVIRAAETSNNGVVENKGLQPQSSTAGEVANVHANSKNRNKGLVSQNTYRKHINLRQTDNDEESRQEENGDLYLFLSLLVI